MNVPGRQVCSLLVPFIPTHLIIKRYCPGWQTMMCGASSCTRIIRGLFFDDIRMERIVDKATELGLYTVVHGGIDIGLPDPIRCTPARTVKVLQDTGTDKLIVAHMGGWTLWDEVEELLIGRNVYLDTSFSIDCLEGVQGLLNKERFTRMVRDHGADRILFGTDSPWCDQKQSKEWILHTDLTGEEKEKILGENARKLLGFSCKMER